MRTVLLTSILGVRLDLLYWGVFAERELGGRISSALPRVLSSRASRQICIMQVQRQSVPPVTKHPDIDPITERKSALHGCTSLTDPHPRGLKVVSATFDRPSKTCPCGPMLTHWSPLRVYETSFRVLTSLRSYLDMISCPEGLPANIGPHHSIYQPYGKVLALSPGREGLKSTYQ